MLKSELLRLFKHYMKAILHYKTATINNRVYETSIFLLYAENNALLGRLEAVNFSDYLYFRYQKKVYTRTYTNKIIQNLRFLYKWLHEDGIIKHNPALLLETSVPEKRIPTVLTMYEIYLLEKTFENTITGLRNAAIFETLLSTGLRISECLNLTVNDLMATHAKTMGKGSVERLIIINEAARAKIKHYLMVRTVDSQYLFCNTNGTKLTRTYYNQVLKTKAMEAGLKKKVTPHTLRHSFATLLYEGGSNLIEIRNLLGHASVTTTEIYSKINVEHLRGAIRHHPRNKGA